MGQDINLIFSLIFDQANIAQAINILTNTILISLFLALGLDAFHEHVVWDLHSRFSWPKSLWVARLLVGIELSLDNFLDLITPACVVGSIDLRTDYDRACARSLSNIFGSLISMPAKLLRPTLFKFLLFLIMLTWYVPSWPGRLIETLSWGLQVSIVWVNKFPLGDYIKQLNAAAALLCTLLFGGAFAIYRANKRRRDEKLEKALEYQERMINALHDLRWAARKNIDALHKEIKNLSPYIRISSEREERGNNEFIYNNALPWMQKRDISAGFEPVGEYVNKVVDSLVEIEKQNLSKEYFFINRSVSRLILRMDLYSQAAAQTLGQSFLDPSYVSELFSKWLAHLSWLDEKEREHKLREYIENLLAESIKNEVLLSRFLKKSKGGGIFKRILFGIGSAPGV
ncbi:MAG TPA: hypothetical protein VKB86_17355 [Pyrinomonadaceae bacterium]|nr:hypothetical protein [Pyrinomonadaceae bacterium]